jgi:hypothetical protein
MLNKIKLTKQKEFTMKNLILVAVLLLVVSSLSFAQPSSANATVSVTVNATLSIFKTNDLALGTVSRGSSVTVLSTDAAAAAFAITGVENNATTMNVTLPATLSNGTSTMSFLGQVPVCNTSNTQVGATALAGLTGGSATTNAVGNLWLWIGGGVNVGIAQQSGNYTGLITVAVTQP